VAFLFLDVVGSPTTDFSVTDFSMGWDELGVTMSSSPSDAFLLSFFVFFLESSLCIPASYVSTNLDIISWVKFYWSSFFQLPPCVLKAWTTKSFIKPW
jgi:hypothetical protein